MNVSEKNENIHQNQDFSYLVFEDNFNALNNVINNGPVTAYAINKSIAEIEAIQNENEVLNNNLLEKPITKSFKYYLLCFFSIINFFYGMFSSLIGPSMPELIVILNTTMEKLSFMISFRSVIYCFIIPFVDILFRKVGGRQYQYCISLFIFGLTSGLIPLLNSFKQYLIVVLINSICSCFIDSVNNLVILELFSLNSKLYLQILHFSFTFGTVVGPILVSPFLSKNLTQVVEMEDIFNLKNNFSQHNLTINSDNLFSRISKHEFKSKLYIPFGITAGFLIICSLIMIISQIIKPYNPVKRKLVAKNKFKNYDSNSVNVSTSSNENPQNLSLSDPTIESKQVLPKVESIVEEINLPKIYYFTLIGLSGFLISIYSSIDMLSGIFMPTFLQKSELKIDQKNAAYMASIINITMAIGRFFTIIFSYKITCKILLFLNFFTIAFGYIFLTFFSIHSKVFIWLSVAILGFGYSSTYPLILSYSENRIIITNTIQLFYMFSGAILLLFLSPIVGYFLESKPMIFLYINLSLSILNIILMFLIHFTDIWKRKLLRKLKEDRKNLIEEHLD